MHERRYGAGMLMQPNGEGCEDGCAVAFGVAVERVVDMLKAALHRYAVPRQERELRGLARQPLERAKAVDYGQLPDRVHLRVHVEGRKARSGLADLRNA